MMSSSVRLAQYHGIQNPGEAKLRNVGTPAFERHIYRCLEATCAELGAEVLALGGVEDHVHLVVRLPTTLAVAELVKRLKGASWHLMTHEVAPDDCFKWQGGYAAFTAGLRHLTPLCDYVCHQKEHHRIGSLIPSYEPPAHTATPAKQDPAL